MEIGNIYDASQVKPNRILEKLVTFNCASACMFVHRWERGCKKGTCIPWHLVFIGNMHDFGDFWDLKIF